MHTTARGLKIIFAGTPEFAAQHLQALLNSHHRVCAVYTQPDRQAGRGRKLQASPVKALALSRELPVFQPVSLKNEAEQQTMAALKADVMVVVAYGLILPSAILKTPRLGCINVHASLLPRWRGAAPIQRALIAGDQESGISYMQMNEGLDTGDVLHTLRCPIITNDTASTLHDRLAKLGSAYLAELLDQLATHSLTAHVQDNTHANYAPKLDKNEAQINWQESATVIERKIRAFNPWPVAFSHRENDIVRIWQARVSADACTAAPGTILAASKQGISVATAQGVLNLELLQLAGGKVLTCEQVLTSKKDLFLPGKQFVHIA